MLKRRQVFAGILIGPGTGRWALPQVRVFADTIAEAESALVADQARFPGSAEHFTQSVVLAELLTLDGWPDFELVVHPGLGPEDRYQWNATLRLDGAGAAWAHVDSFDEITFELLWRAVAGLGVLRTNDDRSPRASTIPLFVLALRHALGGGFTAETQRSVVDWAIAGETLYRRWKSLRAWWPRWCKSAWLVEAAGGADLQETEGFVLAQLDRGHDYPNSVWWTEESAQAAANDGEAHGSSYRVVPVSVLRSPDAAQAALACYPSTSGGYWAAVFQMILPESDDDPEAEWLRRFQDPVRGSGETREQAWLKVLSDAFWHTLVHFPKFPPKMIELPLAALAREGYQVPEEIQQRLDAWVRVVETAQQSYGAAMAAVKEQMPR